MTTWVKADCECCKGKKLAWRIKGAIQKLGSSHAFYVRCVDCRMGCSTRRHCDSRKAVTA